MTYSPAEIQRATGGAAIKIARYARSGGSEHAATIVSAVVMPSEQFAVSVTCCQIHARRPPNAQRSTSRSHGASTAHVAAQTVNNLCFESTPTPDTRANPLSMTIPKEAR